MVGVDKLRLLQFNQSMLFSNVHRKLLEYDRPIYSETNL